MFQTFANLFPKPKKEDGGDEKDGEKKTTEKPKLTYLSSKNFSQKFEHLYNNPKYSDCKIKFEKSKNEIPAHKIILTSSSEYFTILFQSKMMEEKTSEVIIDKDENEEFFKKFLKFLYTGSFDYSNERDIIFFILTSNKYLVKEISDFKIPSKRLLKIIIDYIEEDFDGRIKTFDSLIQYVDFRVFEKEELLLVFKKVKWMSVSLVFLSALLQKDVDSELGNDEDEKEEQIEFENMFKSQEEQVTVGTICTKFDKKYAGNSCSVSSDGKKITFSGGGWTGAALGCAGNKYSIKVVTYVTEAMVGFATRSFNKAGNNYSSSGYYLYLNQFTLYGQAGSCTSGQQYGSSQGATLTKVGDVIGAHFDKRKGEISFYLNGKNLGVAFRNIKDKNLYPCIDFGSNATFEMVKGKYSKK